MVSQLIDDCSAHEQSCILGETLTSLQWASYQSRLEPGVMFHGPLVRYLLKRGLGQEYV